jgi:hypothetical protein
VSPWLIVTTRWPALTVMAGHSLVAARTLLLLPVLGVSAAALVVGAMVRLRQRHHRKPGASPPTPSAS